MTKNIKFSNSELIDKLIVSQIKQVMKQKYKEYEMVFSIIKEINLNIRNKIYLDSKLINDYSFVSIKYFHMVIKR